MYWCGACSSLYDDAIPVVSFVLKVGPRLCSSLGNPLGAFNLGMWYLEGTRPCCRRDYHKARHFLEKAAEEGIGMAQAMLGRMHEKGIWFFFGNGTVFLEWGGCMLESVRTPSISIHLESRYSL